MDVMANKSCMRGRGKKNNCTWTLGCKHVHLKWANLLNIDMLALF